LYQRERIAGGRLSLGVVGSGSAISKYLIYPEFFGSGGVLPTNNTVIIPFQNTDLRRRLGRPLVPSGNGHALVRENLAISDGRWRCRRCGAARAARFRATH